MKKIISLLQKCCMDFSLIEDGDKIAIGISGGKDSLTLIKAMRAYQKYSKQKFDIEAITIDLTNGTTNWQPVKDFCAELGVNYTVIKSNVFEIVFDIRKEKNPCSLCAKMRRGLLNETAVKLGCNKVALAHHADDFIETFLMSLLYEGRLSTFWPKSYLSQTKLTVIRPLIYVWENMIKSEEKSLPVIKNICKADKHTKREETKKLIEEINSKLPQTKEQILTAILHDERYNMLDKARQFFN